MEFHENCPSRNEELVAPLPADHAYRYVAWVSSIIRLSVQLKMTKEHFIRNITITYLSSITIRSLQKTKKIGRTQGSGHHTKLNCFYFSIWAVQRLLHYQGTLPTRGVMIRTWNRNHQAQSIPASKHDKTTLRIDLRDRNNYFQCTADMRTMQWNEFSLLGESSHLVTLCTIEYLHQLSLRRIK